MAREHRAFVFRVFHHIFHCSGALFDAATQSLFRVECSGTATSQGISVTSINAGYIEIVNL